MTQPTKPDHPVKAGEKAPAVRAISKATTVYNQAEDRMSMSGELSDGSKAVLWLTRRLVQRMVPELLGWLQATDQEADLPRSDVINSFKQQSAARKLASNSGAAAAPVVVEQDSAEWLVTAVDLQKRPELLRLVFRAPQEHEERVVLDLAPLALRQWLNILMVGYQRAEWPLEVWPDWMQEQLPGQERPSSVPLH